MRARKLINGSHLDPDTLRVVFEAFDQAWETIAPIYSKPEDIEVARLKLAEAVLSLAQNGATEVAVLKEGALAVYADKIPHFQIPSLT